LSLIVGTMVSTWQAVRASQAERLAQEQRQLAERQAIEADRARSAAEAQRQRAGTNFRKARQAGAEYFTLISESKLLDVPGLQPLRKQLLEAALRYYQEFLNQHSADPNVRVELAATYLRVAQVYMQNNRTDDSIRTLRQAIPILQALLREKPRV